ncbi:HAMP domain-containing protein [Paenibacillus sp. LMG 31456]|uniref:HAMP domain-containing protein n=2 Tax=Paenibacillus foliorum TaxID=2654974 RepID=A0A972H4J3_9BACL|nr:HAMP domain-containing protein [Paenibacillus foliorum]
MESYHEQGRFYMWLKRSLFAKLLIGMLISVIIPLSLSAMISYKTTSRSMERQVIELNQSTMDSGMDNIKQYLNDLNHISLAFYYDQTLMRYLRSREIVPAHMMATTSQLVNIYNSRPEFRAVRYVSALTGESIVNADIARVGINMVLPSTAIPQSESEVMDNARWYEVNKIGGELSLAFHKPIVDYPRAEVLGMVSIYAGLSEIEKRIRPLTIPAHHQGVQVFLYMQKDMKLLYSSANVPAERAGEGLMPELPGERGSISGKWKGSSGIYIYVRDHYLDLPLTIVKFVPLTVVNESAVQTLNRSLIIQLIAVVFVLVLAAILSYLTIAPVKRLLRSIARVETGNFEIGPSTGRMDEFGVLEHRFQTMVRNLDDLMNREYRNRLELSTARLKMLQAQINPHFLYNTFQSIGTLALRQGSEEVSEKIAELGAILRYSMDLQTETVPLQKEIQHIEHYLSLQMGRFKNKLSYTLSCSPEAMSMHVPKMILQPLVENSIIHGFEKGRGSGTIHIGIETDQQLCIRVMDNGKGMNALMVQRIKQEYAKHQFHTGQDGGIGLINVLTRLRLHYDPGFDWDIQSAPYEATVISLQIPIDSLNQEAN